MTETVAVRTERRVTIVTIERPEQRNAVDGATARALFEAFLRFDADAASDVAVFTGSGRAFCAGVDLKELARGERPLVEPDGDLGPMGPTRQQPARPAR